jgi:1-acyl-sn-glycerol-3-phosphate acyltransferase
MTARMLAFKETRAGRALVSGLLWYFHAQLEGADRIPRAGGALLVGNHAAFGVDSFVLSAVVAEHAGRYVRFVGEKNLWRLAPFARFFEAVGALPGDREQVLSALREGELVGVYPGGIVDSLKLRSERHRLMWGQRAGFAQVAMRARVPILPVAGVGIDDTYRVVWRERWIGRRLMGSPRYDLPIAVGAWGTPLPRRAPHRFVVGAPIAAEGDPDRPEDVLRLREATRDALVRLLERDAADDASGEPPAVTSARGSPAPGPSPAP